MTTTLRLTDIRRHYWFLTNPGQPFLSANLCDIGHNSRARYGRFGGWASTDCPRCLTIGPEGVAALLALPDAVLVSLGALPTSDEAMDALMSDRFQK